jgi:hypothetical protein
MKLISLKMGLAFGALALAACANDKPAGDASSQTTTTSARAPDGMMSANPNDTNATGAATNESPNPNPTGNAQDVVVTTTAKNGSNAGATNSGSTVTTDTSTRQTRAHGNDAHPQTWGNDSTPAPGSAGNAAGASQPPATTAPPPPPGSGSSSLTPIDQGNNSSDLKITQQIRKQVVSDSSLSFTAKNVKIITVNGRVTLKGQVNSDDEKKWIEATADKVVGNANVDNQITVKQ